MIFIYLYALGLTIPVLLAASTSVGNPDQVPGGNCSFWGERIWSVTMTAGTKKMIVTQVHIKAAAHSCS